MSAVFTHRNRCYSADMGHSGRLEKQDEKDVTGVRVTDSRGESANSVGDTRVFV